MDIYVHHFSHVVTQSQMLIFSGLVFFLFLPLLKRTDTISIDFDWFYRKGGTLIYIILDKGLNGLNTWADQTLARSWTANLSAFFQDGPARLLLLVVKPFWQLTGVSGEGLGGRETAFIEKFSKNRFSIGSVAVFAALFLLVLVLI
jgi:multicomponent Na+:H+ antiporter subunit D